MEETVSRRTEGAARPRAVHGVGAFRRVELQASHPDAPVHSPSVEEKLEIFWYGQFGLDILAKENQNRKKEKSNTRASENRL